MTDHFRTQPPWAGSPEAIVPPGFEVVAEFPNVQWGWEMDSYYWILRNPDGALVLGTTAHGEFRFVEGSELLERIDELTDFIRATRRAYDMLSIVGCQKQQGDSNG